MRFHEESFHCNTCTENINSLSLYATKSGSVVFTNEQIEIFSGLPEANYTNKLLNKIVNIMKQYRETAIPPFRVELCTDKTLMHHREITRDGPEFEHHVGHVDRFWSSPLPKKQKIMMAEEKANATSFDETSPV